MKLKVVFNVLLTGLLIAGTSFAQSDSRAPTASSPIVQDALPVVQDALPVVQDAPVADGAVMESSVINQGAVSAISGCGSCGSTISNVMPMATYPIVSNGCSGCSSGYSTMAPGFSSGCSGCGTGVWSGYPDAGYGYGNSSCGSTGGFWHRSARPMWFGRRHSSCGY